MNIGYGFKLAVQIPQLFVGLVFPFFLAASTAAAAIEMNDTKSAIKLDGGTHEVAGWIWRNLVPKAGQASTVQGEMLRVVEKLRWEAQNNGNANWDEGFEKLRTYLGASLTAEKRLAAPMLAQVQRDLNRISKVDQPYLEDDLYDRLTDAVVAYCRINPVLIAKPSDATLHRKVRSH